MSERLTLHKAGATGITLQVFFMKAFSLCVCMHACAQRPLHADETVAPAWLLTRRYMRVCVHTLTNGKQNRKHGENRQKEKERY